MKGGILGLVALTLVLFSPAQSRAASDPSLRCLTESDRLHGKQVTLMGKARIKFDGLANNPRDSLIALLDVNDWWCEGAIRAEIDVEQTSGDRQCTQRAPATVTGRIEVYHDRTSRDDFFGIDCADRDPVTATMCMSLRIVGAHVECQ
jgi:hypothetical protein